MLKWLFNCTPEYAEIAKRQGISDVVFGEPQGPNQDGFVGYYVDTDKIERCPADMEPTVKDEANVDL